MHVGLLVLQQCISAMTVRECNRQLKPHNDWQCLECLAVNEKDPDFDDRACGACLAVSLVAEHQLEEEEVDSPEPDVESPLASTDSDSLAGPV